MLIHAADTTANNYYGESNSLWYLNECLEFKNVSHMWGPGIDIANTPIDL